jgi:hypothetical protein
MPIHDWTRVETGIFHDFHQGWIQEIKRALNAGILPEDYYALAEQYAAGFGPDVLTLEGPAEGNGASSPSGGTTSSSSGGGLLLAPPKACLAAETDMAFYRSKQSTVAVRHVSGDRIVAMVEVVSPSNKSSRHGFRSFVEKAAELLEKRVHLLVLDLHPPGKRDPHGIHWAIWEEITGKDYTGPNGRPLTLASYETATRLRAYVERVAVGDVLPEMPLFLEPGAHVVVPLEATYQAAYAATPRRWRRVLEAPPA